MQEVLRHTNHNLWLFGVVLSSLILVALVRNLYPMRVRQVISGVLYNGQFQQMLREETARVRWSNTLLTLNYSIVLSVLMYLAVNTYADHSLRPSALFFWILGAVIGFQFLMYAINLLFAKLIGSDLGIHDHLFQVSLNRSLSGLTILPLAFIAPFIPEEVLPLKITLIAGGIIFLVFHIHGLLRGLLTARREKIHPLYIILYLCSLEILPFVVLGRLLSRYFN